MGKSRQSAYPLCLVPKSKCFPLYPKKKLHVNTNSQITSETVHFVFIRIENTIVRDFRRVRMGVARSGSVVGEQVLRRPSSPNREFKQKRFPNHPHWIRLPLLDPGIYSHHVWNPLFPRLILVVVLTNNVLVRWARDKNFWDKYWQGIFTSICFFQNNFSICWRREIQSLWKLREWSM